MGVRPFERQMMTAAGEPVATDERVYHMVPTSVYDQVMQEGLKPMVGEGTRKVHPNAVPYIHAHEEPETLVGAYGGHVYDNYGPFHVISAPAHYFQYVEPDDNDELPPEYKGTGAELATSISDQHIPAHELRHEHDWDSPFVQQQLMDLDLDPRTAAQWLPDEYDVSEYTLGQCAAWAAAHQQEYPHLRFGMDWERLDPDDEDFGLIYDQTEDAELPEYQQGDEEDPDLNGYWRPQHIFTHDDKYFYDVEGVHPLSQLPQWDDYTLNHDLHDVEMTGMLETGYMPSPEWIRTYAPAPRTAAADDQRRVYHMVPDSSYDQVMSEGLKPMASDALKSVWPEAKPYIHAGPDIETLLGQNGQWVEENHGPFHVISAPRHYFQYADPDSAEYEGTGVEPYTYYSDQHIPANELRHEEDWDAINQLYEW